MNEIVLRTNKGEYSPGEEICGYANLDHFLHPENWPIQK